MASSGLKHLRPMGGQFLLMELRTCMSSKTNSCIFSPERGKKNLRNRSLKPKRELGEWPVFFREHVDADSILDTASLFCARVTPSEDTLTRFYHQEAPMHPLTTPMTWKSVCFTLHVSPSLWRTAEEGLSVPLVARHCFYCLDQATNIHTAFACSKQWHSQPCLH